LWTDFWGLTIRRSDLSSDSRNNPIPKTYSGFATTITDPDGGKKTEYQDYLGRIIEVDEFAGGQEWYRTTYDYDATGHLLIVTNPLGHSTSIYYDTLGRKIKTTDPQENTGTLYLFS
jgi:YD repeat-containing protein